VSTTDELVAEIKAIKIFFLKAFYSKKCHSSYAYTRKCHKKQARFYKIGQLLLKDGYDTEALELELKALEAEYAAKRESK